MVAEKRMFAKTIIDSDAFLDMPLSTQALYFHLSMRADDDGFINNPKNIQRMIGATNDDAKILIMKNFIIPFESGIVAIKHWKIHNCIRKDRKKETAYPDEMSMLEEKENGAYTLRTDIKEIMTDKCLTYDSQVTDNSQHRLDKVIIDKDIIEEYIGISGDKKNTEKIDYQLVADMYNDTCVSFPHLTKLSESRKKAIKARLHSYSIEDFKTLFAKAETSSFLKGANNRNWTASFDWLIKDSNMAKVLDGNYDDNKRTVKNTISKNTGYEPGFDGSDLDGIF